MVTAKSRRDKHRRAARARGELARVDAADVTAHVQALLAAGFSCPAIAAATGGAVSRETVRLVSRREQVDVETAHALLRVGMRPVPAQAGMSVPSVGAVRRLRALAAVGWSQRELVTVHGVRYPAGGRSVLYETWAEIAACYDRLSALPGGGPSRSARLRATGPVPMSWHGRDMDDPAVHVRGHATP